MTPTQTFDRLFAHAPAQPHRPREAAAVRELASLVDRYGPACLSTPGQLRGLLAGIVQSHARDVFAEGGPDAVDRLRGALADRIGAMFGPGAAGPFAADLDGLLAPWRFGDDSPAAQSNGKTRETHAEGSDGGSAA